MKELNKTYNSYVLYLLFFCIVVSIFLNGIYAADKTQAAINQTDKVYLPIIMYHQVKEKGLGKDAITPGELENDLKYLKENHYNTITMEELLDFVYEDKSLPKNPIILTFDDGYLSTYKYVFPLLKKYNMKVVLSIVGKSTDDFTTIKDENIEYSHITWEQLNEMLESGLIEVQNHTYNMHTLKNGRKGCDQKTGESFDKYQSVLADDLTKLQEEILEKTGKVPSTFTYPYGVYNDNTVTIIKQLGFKAGLSCRYGINVVSKNMNLYQLRRMSRGHGESVQKIIKEIMELIS